MGIKLIEVALPLDAINAASAREKSIRHGHPSTLHLWWARRPLAACRAVLFASIVDDPSSPDYRWRDGATRARSEEEVLAERKRLHELIERLVQWENSTNEAVLNEARAEIMRATDGNPPPVLDPFAGGGSIPLEAQRLGLEAHASDLNPVAVLINKALIEIPPKFAGQSPVNPVDRTKGMGATWKGAAGLAADVRHYGRWMRDEAERRIGHLYPRVHLPKEQGGGEATVIAWLWARTVTCPNPACGAMIPMARSFQVSKKANRETWAIPVVNNDRTGVDFSIGSSPKTGFEGTIDGKSARCCVCGEPALLAYVRTEAQAKRMGAQMMAVVAEGARGRIYLAPNDSQIARTDVEPPSDVPETSLPEKALGFRVQAYGMTKHRDLFTPRQLVALTTFSDLVGEARARARIDAVAAGLADDGIGIAAGGVGAAAYADAVATYLGICVSRLSDICNALVKWSPSMDQVNHLFTRQAIPMVWDFAEPNVFAGAAGDYRVSLGNLIRVVEALSAFQDATVAQHDVTSAEFSGESIVSTDPPYYDNIGYADLSDFFYVWLRKSLMNVFPDLFRTVLVPKAEELVATPYRFDGDRRAADAFFQGGLQKAFAKIREAQTKDLPLTVYYAFKQSDEVGSADEEESFAGVVSTGWETMLEGLVAEDFVITGTWPVRTERGARSISIGTNALASSIVIVCRAREAHAPTTSRNEFLRELRRELPKKLKTMQGSSIAPVDLAQAAIGPGMAIYSRYAAVTEPNGERLRVRAALQLINQVLDETLSEQDSAYDRETGWAVAWFEQYGMDEAEFGRAETLATARAVSVEGLRAAGIINSGRGRVRLIPRAELPADWDPASDKHLTDWEIVHYLIRALDGGRESAAVLKAKLGGRAEIAKELAYRLYTICERKGRAQEALAYNALVVEWPEIDRAAAAHASTWVEQTRF